MYIIIIIHYNLRFTLSQNYLIGWLLLLSGGVVETIDQIKRDHTLNALMIKKIRIVMKIRREKRAHNSSSKVSVNNTLRYAIHCIIVWRTIQVCCKDISINIDKLIQLELSGKKYIDWHSKTCTDWPCIFHCSSHYCDYQVSFVRPLAWWKSWHNFLFVLSHELYG